MTERKYCNNACVSIKFDMFLFEVSYFKLSNKLSNETIATDVTNNGEYNMVY